MSMTPGADEKTFEEIGSDGKPTGLEVEVSDELSSEIKAPFDPAKIDVITQQKTIALLLTRLKEGEIDLSPDFQRRANVWSPTRKSGLIESILLRIPLPSLYVSEDSDGNYVVVDGLQRMCAIAHFVDVAALNKSVVAQLDPLRLKNLQSLSSEYNGRSFDELPRALQRRISETELTLHVIRPSTPTSVKFNIFSRINQGGLPLTPQEIRNAIYADGYWRGVVRNLASSDEFLQATEGKIKGERMEDLELVLRSIAHFTCTHDRPDQQNLDDFLNEFVGTESLVFSDQIWKKIEADFKRAMVWAPKIFGRHAFRKYYGYDTYRRPINRGLFESEVAVLSKFDEWQLEKLSQHKSEVLANLAALFGHKGFTNALLYATGRGMSSNIRRRELARILGEVLNDHQT